MGDKLAELGATSSREEFERSGQVVEMIIKLANRPDEYFIVAAFPDRETYVANAEHPNTHRNYERMRELLVADPEWNDGEVIDMLGVGGI